MAQVAKERGFQIQSMENRFKTIAAENGLEFKSNDKIYNTRLAHELSAWASENGNGSGIHQALFIANYVENKDISDIDVLSEIAQSVGLLKKDAKRVLEKRVFQDHVDKDWALCKQLDIVAAPTYVIKQNRLVGAQSYDIMERFAKNNGAVKSV